MELSNSRGNRERTQRGTIKLDIRSFKRKQDSTKREIIANDTRVSSIIPRSNRSFRKRYNGEATEEEFATLVDLSTRTMKPRASWTSLRNGNETIWKRSEGLDETATIGYRRDSDERGTKWERNSRERTPCNRWATDDCMHPREMMDCARLQERSQEKEARRVPVVWFLDLDGPASATYGSCNDIDNDAGYAAYLKTTRPVAAGGHATNPRPSDGTAADCIHRDGLALSRWVIRQMKVATRPCFPLAHLPLRVMIPMARNVLEQT